MATEVHRTGTVNRDRQAVYAFWRQLEHLPRFMPHLVSVEERSSTESHWVATGPGGKQVEWDAQLTVDEPGKRIGWKSHPDSGVSNSGEVRFRDAPGGRGTEVEIALDYAPPLGPIGKTVAKLFGEEPDQQIRDALRALKQVLEAGEIPTTEGQPSGRVPEEERKIAEQIRSRFNEQFRADTKKDEAAS